MRRHAILLGMLLFVPPALASTSEDARLITRYRDGMRSLIDNTRLPQSSVPSRAEREEARAVWRSFLDYQVALETIRNRHDGFLSMTGAKRSSEFRTYHAAWLAQYRAALDFVARMERHPELHTMLNESVPSLGLGSGSYAAFKLHWLHVTRAVEWSTFALLDKTAGGQSLPGADADARAILAAGAGRGTVETVRNAARVVGEAAWNPLPSSIAAVAGGPAAVAPRPSFISKAQIAKRARSCSRATSCSSAATGR